jgi:hypothetical protein
MSGLEDFEVKHISEISIKGDRAASVVMTKQEWLDRANELFGPDMMKWRFVCPACGNIAAIGDFYPYRDKGATPDSATHECIGRYDGHLHVVMGTEKPCNYTGYGLLDFCPVRVMDGEEELRCFAFDESGEVQDGKSN